MAFLRLILPIIFIMGSRAHSNDLRRYHRETAIDLCDSSFNSKTKVQCFCKNAIIESTPFVFKAECTIEENNILFNDVVWRAFASINTIERVTFSSKGEEGILTYIPTIAFKTLKYLLKAIIQHGKIENVHEFAFANLTNIQEITLSANSIKTLSVNAFAHHPNLTVIILDKNDIEEVKRNAFRRLPQLQELFLTKNNISIIHDRAFSHLSSLQTLELDYNQLFVLTSETFSGLVNLTRLELSYNNLEVIGDNTFAALQNVRYINLANNKLKMLDDKAFQGAIRLETLSLANNKLKELSNGIIFSGLPSLKALDLRANGMTVLTLETVAPILPNLYGNGSSITFEDNMFTCHCKLNWFLTLKNRTQNRRLQEAINNLMCYPSTKLAEDFKKYEESEKKHAEDRRAEEGTNTNSEYDYYDETSLDGKLFFSDIPERMVPCDDNNENAPVIPSLSPATISKLSTPTIQAESDFAETSRNPTIEYPSKYSVSTESHLTTALRVRESPSVYTSVSHRDTTEMPKSTLLGEISLPSEMTSAVRAKNEMLREATTLEPVSFTAKRYTPFASDLIIPTEDMVSDGESIEENKTKYQNVDNKSVSRVSAEISKNEKTSRGVIDDDNATKEIINVRDKKTAPKSMSHVHVSKASTFSSRILYIIIPMYLSLLV